MCIKQISSVLLVIALSTGVPAQIRTCDDCQDLQSCQGAVELANRMDKAAEAQLRGAFCGLSDNGLPKICCSDFASQEEKELDRHPNLSLLPDNCGKMDPNRIIGGTVAGLYEFPWMVLIGFNTRTGFRFACGGSLINENYVLTAAHCVKGRNIAGIRVGEHNIDTVTDCTGVAPKRVCEDKLQDRRVEKEIVHSGYSQAMGNDDIALLRLKTPINLTLKNAGTVCLPVTSSQRMRIIAKQEAIVAGWGVTELRQVSSTLLKVSIPVFTSDECKGIYNKNLSIISDTQICAGGVGHDSCKGDSGGPMMVEGNWRTVDNKYIKRYIQYGLVSFGPKQCGLQYPGVYTDITKYMKWILDTIEK